MKNIFTRVFLTIFILSSVFFSEAQDNTPLYAKVKRLEGQGNGGNWLNITDNTRNRIMAGAPWKVQDVEYEAGTAPIIVRLFNPTHLQNYKYKLKIAPLQNAMDNSLVDTSAHWILEWYNEIDSTSGSYTSQYSIGQGIEEILEDHGIAITVKNHPFSIQDVPLETYLKNYNKEQLFSNISKYAQPDLVGSRVKYEGTHHWLGGLQDAETFTPNNWIRAGHQISSLETWMHTNWGDGANAFYLKWRQEDFFTVFNNYEYENNYNFPPNYLRGFIDYHGQYEHITDGLWAPYMMTSPYDGGPKANYITPDTALNYDFLEYPQPYCYDFRELAGTANATGYNQTLTNLYSVDIVFTPDQNKWTRALVLEAGSGTEANGYKVTQHFNGQTYYNIRHEPKTCPSVDKNGNPDNSGTTGFGWFPGYAINVETGERLNIMFAENSEDEYNRGNDMIFNPTNVYAFKKDNTGACILGTNGQPIPMEQSEYDSLYLSIYDGGLSANFLGEPLNGGRHYIYICGSSGNTANTYYRSSNSQRNYNDNGAGGTFTGTDGVEYPYYECGVYDEGKWLSEKFKTFAQDTNFNERNRRVRKMQVFNNVMWTSIPMPAEGEEANWLDNDATVQIRVSRPYMFYSSAVGTHPDIVTNNNAPTFEFSMENINTMEEVSSFDLESIIEERTNRIDINAIDALIRPSAGCWFLSSINEGGFFFPKGTHKCTYSYYGFSLGGLDENEQLHLMGETSRPRYDSWPGPLSTVDASVDYTTVLKWNRTFKIKRDEVTEFLDNYQNPEYLIPQSILDWPAHGDTSKGQAWLLAPFVDVDNNNHYEPEHGDYPDFPGDMALFVIFNDNYAQHKSDGAPLGVETHVMVYAYDAPEDTIMNNTIFIKYKIHNRSQHNYHNTYIGIDNYWDLGYYRDNYIGFDIKKNTAYCYNAFPWDGISGEEEGIVPDNAYGYDWPVQTLTLLSGPLMPADSIDNPAYTDSANCSLFINNGLNEYAINGTGFGDSIVDNERYGLTGFLRHGDDSSIFGDPKSAEHIYKYMQSLWFDSTHLSYGATGIANWGATGIDCRFSYYGNTDSPCNFATYGVEVPDSLYGPDGWTAAAVGNFSSIGFASAGPFNLNAGEMQEFEFALTTIPHYLAVTRGDVSIESLQSVDNQYRDKVFTPSFTYTQHATICEGETYTFFDQICDTTGLYHHRVRNAEYDNYLQDTVWLLYLTVEPLYTLIYAAIVPGQGYYENGFNISSSQTTNPGTQMFYETYNSHSGCDSSVVLLLDVRVDASIENHNNNHSLKIYPNPTTQIVTIEIDDDALLQKHEYVMVFDMFGKLLQNMPLTDNHMQINLGAYSSGTYIVKVGNRVGKVVKR